jgi:phosphatidylglycerol:prolipoprotein diacylglycerol transferase
VGGVAGARISYVIEHWSDFSGNLVEAAKVTSGGLVFDGGLILALVLVLAYLYRKRLPVRRFMDIMAISAMVGLAFGRVGCLLNGCCYGGLCDERFPLAVHFPYSAPPLVAPHDGVNPYPPGSSPSPVYSHQVAQGQLKDVPPDLMYRGYLKAPEDLKTPAQVEVARHAHSLAVQPAQVYGIVNALVLAGLLSAFFRLRTREGQVFALMLILYPITRFVLEYIRDDNPGMALTPAQVKCLFIAAGGIIVMALLRLLPASSGPTGAERLAAAEAKQTPVARGRNRRRT